MVYQEYEQIKMRYDEAQERCVNLLLEKEKLFTDTFPKGITYDKDKVQASPESNPLEKYVMTLDEKQIDEKIDQLTQIIKAWGTLLETKEKEVRKSQCVPDRIYTMRYLDGMGIKKISSVMNYSRSQVHRVLTRIESYLGKMRQNATKCDIMTH